MKRNTLFICLSMLLLVLCSCGKQKELPDEFKNEEYLDEKIVDVVLLSEISLYDESGIEIQKGMCTNDGYGNILTESIDRGELVTEWNETLGVYEIVDGEVDGEVDWTNSYAYDYNRELMEKKYILDPISGGYSEYREYYYNDNKKIVTEYRFKRGDSVPVKWIYSYAGEKMLSIVCEENFEVSGEVRMIYDSDEKLIEIVVVDGEGWQQLRYAFNYDRKGNIESKEAYHAGDELVQRDEYLYNNDGVIEEERRTEYINGEKNNTIIVRYSYTTVCMPESVAEAYYARSKWAWYLDMTGIQQ